MTKEEKQKAIDALKISAPVIPVTQEKFMDYVQTINKIIDWLEQEPVLDTIRAEIAVLDDADYDYEGYYKAVTDAVKIIDKYRGEQEDVYSN